VRRRLGLEGVHSQGVRGPVSDEIKMAFDHPEVRLAELAGGNPPDRISLRDYIAEADIGAFQVERGQRQRLRFNIAVELRPGAGAAADDVDRILTYDRLTGAIEDELAAERLNLLETLAERIAARILAEPQPVRVFLRIEKLDRGPFALGVEIVRSRLAGPTPGATRAESPRPIIVFAESGFLPDVASLASLGGPVIIAPGLPAGASAGLPAAIALRIDLLEIERVGWAMAAGTAGLTVVSSRTEIDWAMAQGRTIIWAPSKLVLDTAGAPNRAGNGLPLAIWLADLLHAQKLLVHGTVALPADCRVPVARL